MFDVILSLIIYIIFGLIGIFLLKKINFVKKTFNNKQNIIYLSIFFIVFGFFLGQYDSGNTGVGLEAGYRNVTGKNNTYKISYIQTIDDFKFGASQATGLRNPTLYELFGANNYGYKGDIKALQ